jgi:hypothetical protein
MVLVTLAFSNNTANVHFLFNLGNTRNQPAPGSLMVVHIPKGKYWEFSNNFTIGEFCTVICPDLFISTPATDPPGQGPYMYPTSLCVLQADCHNLESRMSYTGQPWSMYCLKRLLSTSAPFPAVCVVLITSLNTSYSFTGRSCRI